MRAGEPPGIRLLKRLTRSSENFTIVGEHEAKTRKKKYRYLVLILTFLAYVCYHASRKPTSIVKSVLFPDPNDDKKGKGWEPFNRADGTVKLGEVDLAFLVFYSSGMYLAGHLGDSLDLRIFLAVGMIGSGLFVILFGQGYFWNVHSFGFFIAMQIFAGLFQATGWPSVVAVVGNWFGKRKRGLIMGIWNAHTSVGNICGSLLAASVLEHGWGWSFVLPGGLIALVGVIVYLFLPAYPEDVGLQSPHEKSLSGVSNRGTAVGIIAACRIPGVVPFALCLFFAKLVAYTFMYWLPFYLNQTAIGGEYMSVKSAGNLSTLFDVGGIIGGVLAGYISDRVNARATTAATFMYLAIPALFAYQTFGPTSKTVNILLMLTAGMLVNGPYSLITTAVSADLGTHSSLNGDSRALATVTAIIDGTGSAGAALGPLLTGILSTKGWGPVFAMLSVSSFTAGALLTFLVKAEIAEILRLRRQKLAIRSEGPFSDPLLGNQSQ